jgi:purine-cytosine permease-like protein
MAKRKITLLGVVAWLTGILVSLAVGFGMIGKTLTIPFIPQVVTIVAGWVVVIGAIISFIIALVGN